MSRSESRSSSEVSGLGRGLAPAGLNARKLKRGKPPFPTQLNSLELAIQTQRPLHKRADTQVRPQLLNLQSMLRHGDSFGEIDILNRIQ